MLEINRKGTLLRSHTPLISSSVASETCSDALSGNRFSFGLFTMEVCLSLSFLCFAFGLVIKPLYWFYLRYCVPCHFSSVLTGATLLRPCVRISKCFHPTISQHILTLMTLPKNLVKNISFERNEQDIITSSAFVFYMSCPFRT